MRLANQFSQRNPIYPSNAIRPPREGRASGKENLEPRAYHGWDEDSNLSDSEEYHEDGSEDELQSDAGIRGVPRTREFLNQNVCIEGYVVVTRSPGLHPGDIVLCKAVRS